MIRALVVALAIALGMIHLPVLPAPVSIESTTDEMEWALYHAEAYDEYADEFTALFNSYEFKQAKNGAPMIRRANEKSYRFVPRGK